MTPARRQRDASQGADPRCHAVCRYWLEAVEVGPHLEVSAMAAATVGVVPAKTPANSGEIPRRRRVDDDDRDGEAKARARSVRAGEVRIDGER